MKKTTYFNIGLASINFILTGINWFNTVRISIAKSKMERRLDEINERFKLGETLAVVGLNEDLQDLVTPSDKTKGFYMLDGDYPSAHMFLNIVSTALTFISIATCFSETKKAVVSNIFVSLLNYVIRSSTPDIVHNLYERLDGPCNRHLMRVIGLKKIDDATIKTIKKVKNNFVEERENAVEFAKDFYTGLIEGSNRQLMINPLVDDLSKDFGRSFVYNPSSRMITETTPHANRVENSRKGKEPDEIEL